MTVVARIAPTPIAPATNWLSSPTTEYRMVEFIADTGAAVSRDCLRFYRCIHNADYRYRTSLFRQGPPFHPIGGSICNGKLLHSNGMKRLSPYQDAGEFIEAVYVRIYKFRYHMVASKLPYISFVHPSLFFGEHVSLSSLFLHLT